MHYSFAILFKLLLFFAPGKKAVPENIYDFKVAALNGKEIDFSAFKGKKILVVNTPWQANTDKQYAELDALQKKYQDRLIIVGFLTEDFGIQPGSKIPAYKPKTYAVSFPIAVKVQVKGPDMTPVFKWLTDKQYNHYKNTNIKWNFQKYLIDEEGRLVAVFDPKVRATDPRVIAAIEE